MNAPIVIFTYKRLDTLERLVKSLLLNREALESDLIIYSDGPKNEVDRIQVEACRKFVKNIRGFARVEIIYRQVNQGLSSSIISGVSEVLKRYETVIVLEDDLVVSPFFLQFMNEGLSKYSDQDNVFSIHGYVYPVKRTLPDTFFLRGADCWGWATWRRSWSQLTLDGAKILNRLTQANKIKEFDFNNSFNFSGMLHDQVLGKNDSWAILWYGSAYLLDKLTLYPGKSLVFNAGNNGLGTHKNISSDYDVELTVAPVFLSEIPIVHSKIAAEAFEEYFNLLNGGYFGKIKKYIKKLGNK